MTTNFRALCAELVEAFKDENTYTQRVEALDRALTALATPPPEPPTSQITFNDPSPPEEVIRLDKEGFHYKGQFVADAGEAHRLMMAFLEQNTKTKPEPPTDEELDEFVVFWWGAYTDESTVTDVIEDDSMAAFTRAALKRWGHV